MRALRTLVSSPCEGRSIPAYSRIAAAFRGIRVTLLRRSNDTFGQKNDASSWSCAKPSSSSSESDAARGARSTKVSRGASFAKNVPSANTGSTPGPLSGPAGLYTHTIVTEADKTPTGVAFPAASVSRARPFSRGGSTPTPRKRYTTVPLRTAASAASEGNKIHGTSSAAGRPTGGSAPSSVSFSASSAPEVPPNGTPGHVEVYHAGSTGIKTAARPQDGPMVPDYGPLRATGMWSVDEVMDEQKKTVDFRRIDDVESDIVDELRSPEEALVPYEEEEKWKHKLMFQYKFKKTPKHLTWRELGEEVECMDCLIEPDEHRPEEIFTISFYFTNKKTGTRDVVWTARNDVSYSEGFTDLLAAVGACLGRSDVHRTIRFDDGVGCTRDVTFRKRSRYTSDIYVAFRPPEKYNKYERREEKEEYEAAMEKEGMSTWGYHPSLMDPEFSELDFQDPEGTYEVAISAHGFSFIILRAINRLLARPMKSFYRPSQLMRTAKVKTEEEIGFVHAMKGWMGVDEQIYQHFTPIEALQDHWLGKDAPFSLCAIVNKLREMNYLKKENPEFQSWLSVRHHDTHLAIRNLGVKLLGAGASPLFVPVQHDATVNRLLPKSQQRRLESKLSLNALLGLPDETRKLDEFKRITGFESITGATPEPGKSPEADGTKIVPAAPDK
ncbi:hypothetical protein ABL78_0047 [Leptomonas seymouri]|uniref:Uncharacterized protein n=1 Tax=Leptomonas seymouri TaxID=5684 RepID=A0A0N1ICK2_LEPSE|nr:hypothetical protein ABL78_0047 [Leptomonas seymouri]|eukprot:KPI90814.1 hypothetical protein ABL78_0047 [Leptomonas seymouri]